jgi:hypothetical protein
VQKAMHVVGIHSLNEGRKSRTAALAAALGVTLYEASSRLRVPGNGPLVIAVLADPQKAADLAGRLQDADFPAVLLTAAEIEAESRQPVVKRFSLGTQGLIAESGNGAMEVPYQETGLLLRGTAVTSSTSTETSKERKFSVERALLSGGVMLTKTTKTEREITTQQREGFFALYAKGHPGLLFREGSLSYDSLGAARKHSSSANMAHLISELRSRCIAAAYDERLLNRAAQAALLGPMLRPESHLPVATALLARVLMGRG